MSRLLLTESDKVYACAVCGERVITHAEACQGFDTCESCQPRGKWEPYPDVSERADRFLARVDRELPAMAAAEQRKFLNRLIAIWEQRYSAFIKSGGKSEHYGGAREPIHVNDFTLTIAGLAARRDAI